MLPESPPPDEGNGDPRAPVSPQDVRKPALFVCARWVAIYRPERLTIPLDLFSDPCGPQAADQRRQMPLVPLNALLEFGGDRCLAVAGSVLHRNTFRPPL